jgi:hypothetical protein
LATGPFTPENRSKGEKKKMGWIFSLAAFIVAIVRQNMTLMIASGLFAIAGSISFGAVTLRGQREKECKDRRELWKNILTSLAKQKPSN